MEIAIHHQEDSIQVYMEGVPWLAIAEFFKDQKVKVYLLAFIVGDEYFAHDDRTNVTDDKLNFCKQDLQMSDILATLNDTQLYYPDELRVGNGLFFMNQVFPGGILLKFWDIPYAVEIIYRIADKHLEESEILLERHENFVTNGFTEDYVAANNFDRFIRRRCNKWNEGVVREFEQGMLGNPRLSD